MRLMSSSGTGGGIYAKLANGVARYNCAQGRPPTIHRRYYSLRAFDMPALEQNWKRGFAASQAIRRSFYWLHRTYAFSRAKPSLFWAQTSLLRGSLDAG